jgi:hypothetical protein
MRRRTRKSLAAEAIALGFAAPQVIAHRLSAPDTKEFQRMSVEKIAAFNEAWSAMALQAVLENQKLALSMMQSFWFPWARPRSSLSRQMNDAALSILGKGVAPVRRRAVANAKRLGRVKRKR